MLARIGIMRAVNRHVERVSNPAATVAPGLVPCLVVADPGGGISFHEIGEMVYVERPAMTERRSSHRTQSAAQFAVASELCKRGYEVALTLGNDPAVDLLVVSPRKTTSQIDVNCVYKKTCWQI
jgi:hypothetical protein